MRLQSTPPTSRKLLQPRLRYDVGSTVVPGDRIGSIMTGIRPGMGTYARGGHVYASLVGTLQLRAAAEAEKKEGGGGNDDNSGRIFVVTVSSSKPVASTHVLKVGDVVLAQVSRITTMQCFLVIVALSSSHGGGSGESEGTGVVLRHPCEGTIRREDVRAGASEEVRIQDNYMPGDWVLCRVISLAGDSSSKQKSYFLSTASPELGVVHGTSYCTGATMVPVSWREMECPLSGNKELRKCARPRRLINF